MFMTEEQARAVAKDVLHELVGADADEGMAAMFMPDLMAGHMSSDDLRTALARYLSVDPTGASPAEGSVH